MSNVRNFLRGRPPGAKAASATMSFKNALSITIAIGLTLLGFKMVAPMVTELLPPVAHFLLAKVMPPVVTRPVPYSEDVSVTSSLIDPQSVYDFLGVEVGFKSVARVVYVGNEDVHRGSRHPKYVRRYIHVTLPERMPRDQVTKNLRIVAREAYEGGAMSVAVSAWSENEYWRNPLNMRGQLTFAPYGEWDWTERHYDLAVYKTELWFPSIAKNEARHIR